jgi:hypothetical protein
VGLLAEGMLLSRSKWWWILTDGYVLRIRDDWMSLNGIKVGQICMDELKSYLQALSSGYPRMKLASQLKLYAANCKCSNAGLSHKE